MPHRFGFSQMPTVVSAAKTSHHCRSTETTSPRLVLHGHRPKASIPRVIAKARSTWVLSLAFPSAAGPRVSHYLSLLLSQEHDISNNLGLQSASRKDSWSVGRHLLHSCFSFLLLKLGFLYCCLHVAQFHHISNQSSTFLGHLKCAMWGKNWGILRGRHQTDRGPGNRNRVEVEAGIGFFLLVICYQNRSRPISSLIFRCH